MEARERPRAPRSEPRVRYVAYGLAIDAGFPIPRLLPRTERDAADVTIELVSRGSRAAPDPSSDTPWYKSAGPDDGSGVVILRTAEGRYRMRFADGTECLVDPAGRSVEAILPSGTSPADLAIYLTGPVMGFVLRLRGRLALHASVVVLDGEAVAFVGPPGCGKSSIAAALVLRGASLLAEDIAALDFDGGRPAVLPGHPHIGLWPDSVAALFGAPDALPPLAMGWDKRSYDVRLAGRFVHRPVPLAAVHLLATSAEAAVPLVRAVPAREAVMRLVANVYGNLILHEALRVVELDAAQSMTAALPVRELVRGEGAIDPSAVWDVVAADRSRARGATGPIPSSDVQHC
jgi:hypothetical protein